MRELFTEILKDKYILSEPEELEFYGRDHLQGFSANPALVLLPKSIYQLQKIVEIANQKNLKLVPSGGRTGYSGGATATNQEIIVSLSKFNKINLIDEVNNTIVVGAGAVTQNVLDHLDRAGYQIPIDFASKGSSQIGGNLATNVGGVSACKYGNIRNWVLGFKAVNGKGEVLDLQRNFIKDQRGYDLQNLIIGSEGTLAIITEVTFRLIPKVKEKTRVIIAFKNIQSCLDTFFTVRKHFRSMSMAEYFTHACLKEVIEQNSFKPPFQAGHPHFLLLEFEKDPQSIQEEIIELLEATISEGLIADLIVAQNQVQLDEFLAYREGISEAINKYNIHKNDISIPASSIKKFIPTLKDRVEEKFKNLNLFLFGHIADGNFHINFSVPDDFSEDQHKELDKIIYAVVDEYEGSFSAEHGIGLHKKQAFLEYTDELQINLMREIKQAFDPNNILNPGKIFDC